MKILSLFLTVGLLTLTGCLSDSSSSGVSKDEYAAVSTELAATKEQLSASQGKLAAAEGQLTGQQNLNSQLSSQYSVLVAQLALVQPKNVDLYAQLYVHADSTSYNYSDGLDKTIEGDCFDNNNPTNNKVVLYKRDASNNGLIKVSDSACTNGRFSLLAPEADVPNGLTYRVLRTEVYFDGGVGVYNSSQGQQVLTFTK